MIESTLNGKSSLEIFDNEDFLTSTIFGFLEYFSPAELWNLIFKYAVNIHKENIKDILIDEGLNSINNYKVKLYYWEYFDSYGEPDIVLELYSNEEKKKFLIIIEVKLWSPKSNSNEGDQLIRYLRLFNDHKFRERMYSSSMENIIIGLIYLTPRNSLREIKESIISSKNNIEDSKKLFALRWQEIYDILINIDSESYIYEKLAKFIGKIGLTPFYGFNSEINIDENICHDYKGYTGGLIFSGFKKTNLIGYDNLVKFYESEGDNR